MSGAGGESLDALLASAIEAARRGAAALEPYLGGGDVLDVAEKSRHDFVTKADLAAEAAIRSLIEARHPGHRVLGEEGERVELGGDAPLWIVDPLDGTTNFIHGFPNFAVSVACAIGGRVVAGAVLDPSRGELFTATRGGGAFLAGRRLAVSGRAGLADALVGTGFPFRNAARVDVYLAAFREVLLRSAGVRRPGSAALDLANVAAGRYDAFFEEGLGPWDIAAGALLIEEAGGVVSDFEGQDGYLESGSIVAGTPGAHAEVRAIVAEHLL